MKIDRKDVLGIATLARIELDDDQLDRMATEMSQILTYIEQLNDGGAETTSEEAAAATPLREDIPHQSLDRELVSRNAPEWRDGCFVVPKVIGGD